jgi:molecular chaperone DnaJ
MAKDYYNILGVAEGASLEEIKKKFRELAKRYHPDRNPGDKKAEQKFKEISEAYDVLGDEKKRQQYDTMRKYGAFAGREGGAGDFDYSQFRNGFRFEDLGGLGPFADIFSSIFGDEDLFRRAGRKKRRGRVRGNNLAMKLSIAFEEAISGTSKTIILNKPLTCDNCKGSGEEPGSGRQVCPQCDGRGTVSFAQGAFAISRPCPRCLGRGTIGGRQCHKCNGSGRIKEKTRIKVKIPSGIEDGEKIRLRGMGSPGRDGGEYGDLVITVNVGKHQQFNRKGNDIYTNVEISFPQAVLGAKVAVKSLTKTINLTVPPGTRHGTVLRLRGLGLAVNGAKGDQYVEVHIAVPKTVTQRQKELLEELARTL